MPSETLLQGKACTKALDSTLGAVLHAHGFCRAKNGAYSRARDDGTLIVADLKRLGKFSYPGIASSVAFHLGLGTAPEPSDLGQTAMWHLAHFVGSGKLASEMCRVHNEIVDGWRKEGGDVARVASLLSWPVGDDWQNAPEVLWFRNESDLRAWATFAVAALPTALARLDRAVLDRSRPALWFVLSDQV
jgi:hypothetical protein